MASIVLAGSSSGTLTVAAPAAAGTNTLTLPAETGTILTNQTSTGKILQVVNFQTGAVATGTTTIPNDDTIPQNTEGTEFMTLAITPTSASSKLKIDVATFICGSDTIRLTTALFQDSTANALAAVMSTPGFANIGGSGPSGFTHYMTAGTTSATTFKVRIGGNSSVTVTLNGQSGARRFGGVASSSITITEVAA